MKHSPKLPPLFLVTLLIDFLFDREDGRVTIPPKRRWTAAQLHGVTTLKAIIFLVTAARASNSTVFGIEGKFALNTVQTLRYTRAKPVSKLHETESFLTIKQLPSHSRGFQQFMEPEGSLPRSKGPLLSSVLREKNPNVFKIHLIFSSRLCQDRPSGRFPPGLPTKTLCALLFSNKHHESSWG
jgi:hypothetical protein